MSMILGELGGDGSGGCSTSLHAAGERRPALVGSISGWGNRRKKTHLMVSPLAGKASVKTKSFRAAEDTGTC